MEYIYSTLYLRNSLSEQVKTIWQSINPRDGIIRMIVSYAMMILVIPLSVLVVVSFISRLVMNYKSIAFLYSISKECISPLALCLYFFLDTMAISSRFARIILPQMIVYLSGFIVMYEVIQVKVHSLSASNISRVMIGEGIRRVASQIYVMLCLTSGISRSIIITCSLLQVWIVFQTLMKLDQSPWEDNAMRMSKNTWKKGSTNRKCLMVFSLALFIGMKSRHVYFLTDHAMQLSSLQVIPSTAIFDISMRQGRRNLLRVAIQLD